MKKEKKYYSNEDRRTAYLTNQEFQTLKEKLEERGFSGKGFLTHFLQSIIKYDFILLVGTREGISRFMEKQK